MEASVPSRHCVLVDEVFEGLVVGEALGDELVVEEGHEELQVVVPVLGEEVLAYSEELVLDYVDALVGAEEGAHGAALVDAEEDGAELEVCLGVGGEGYLVYGELQVHEGNVRGQGGEGELARYLVAVVQVFL